MSAPNHRQIIIDMAEFYTSCNRQAAIRDEWVRLSPRLLDVRSKSVGWVSMSSRVADENKCR